MTDRHNLSIRSRTGLITECARTIENFIDILVQFETRFHFFTTAFIYENVTALRETLFAIKNLLHWSPQYQIPEKETRVHQFFLLSFQEIEVIADTYDRITPRDRFTAIRQLQRQCRILHYLFLESYQ